ncbi:MAG: peptidoglycan-binding protein, partial [Clostridia bacterium]|nr:peptidoglycan-binding protein [Clostridia bacterium]
MKRLSRMLCLTLALCMLLSIQMAPAAEAAGSYWIGVDLTNQITTVYRTSDNSVVRHMLCSTGLAATPTPTGTFYLPSKAYSSERTEWYYFKEFDCWAKYATRIKGGILFHSVIYSKKDNSTLRTSSVRNLGSRASHGCIRLTVENAKWIAQNCPVGTKVKIYYGASNPELKASLTGKYTTLKPGSTGSSVTKLQNQLKACGWYDGSATGTYDSATQSAVRAYQAAAGLTVDGLAGTNTQSSLYGSNPKVGMNTTLSEGMNSLAVRQLQSLLKQRGFYSGNVDGAFGAQTRQAVVAYQTAIGETANGVATPALQRRLSTDGSVTPQPAVTPVPTPEPVAIGTATVKVSSTLCMRASASASGKVLTRLKNGTQLTVLDDSGDWVRVLYNGQTGYVSARYVTLNIISFGTPVPAATETPAPDPNATPTPTPEPTATPTPAPQSIGTATVKTSGSYLALRKSASTASTLVAKMPKGAKLTVLAV